MRDKANTENMFYRVETDLELALYEDRIDACANRVIPQRFMQYMYVHIVKAKLDLLHRIVSGLSSGFIAYLFYYL